MKDTRINHQIRARELQVIGENGENFGTLPFSEAMKLAGEQNLDLIEISPNSNPPVAKIADYGKFQYDQKKKQKQQKASAHIVETKTIQIKPATGEHDLQLKAKKISEWLKEGHRIKLDLFLAGRAKYMDRKFLDERMQRVLKLITVDYSVADSAKKSPKGLTTVIERARK